MQKIKILLPFGLMWALSLVYGRAAELKVSSLDASGVITWDNAFTSGVCTVEYRNYLNTNWLPLTNFYTTNTSGKAGLGHASQARFFRCLAVDISPSATNGFGNLTESYGRLRTLAGNGAGSVDNTSFWQSSFEGAYATNAALSRPHFAMADALGNVYIADKNSHAILKVTPFGNVFTVAGTHVQGDGPDASTYGTYVDLSSPNGLWVQTDGTVCILDAGNGKVRTLSPNGMVATLFRDGSKIAVGRGLWVADDSATAYYVNGSTIQEWTADGGSTTLCDSFSDPGNLIMDSDGTLLVTDRGANLVYRIPISGASRGQRTPIAGNGSTSPVVSGTPALNNGLYGVRGIWPVPAGGYLLATHEGSQILYLNAAGILYVFLDGSKYYHDGDGQWFHSPGYKISEARSVTMNAWGDIVIVENDAGFVRVIDFMRLKP